MAIQKWLSIYAHESPPNHVKYARIDKILSDGFGKMYVLDWVGEKLFVASSSYPEEKFILMDMEYDDINDFAVSSDGRYLVLIGSNVVVDLKDNELNRVLSIGENYGPATFSPDGLILAISDYPTMELIDWKNDKVVARIPDGGMVEFSPDGRYLVISGWDGVISIWGIKP